MTRGMKDNISVVSNIDPDDYVADITGTTIDLQGFNSATFALLLGTITDGTFTPKLQHGDASDLSDAADVAAGDINGTLAAAASDTNQTVDYVGTKRYVRMFVTVTGSPATGAQLACAVIKGKPSLAPVS